MSRHTPPNIDLSALPTVADLDDDDLIDRDAKWEEFQREKERTVAEQAPAPEPEQHAPPEAEVHAEPEPESEVAHEPPAETYREPEPEVQPEPEVEFHAPEPEEAPVPAEVAPSPAPAAAEIVIQTPEPLHTRLIGRDSPVPNPPPVSKAPAKAPDAETAPKDDAPGETKESADLEKHPVEIPKPPPDEPLSEEEKRRMTWARLKEKVGLSSLGWSVGIHVALLLLATFIGISQSMDKQVDFLPGGSPASAAASEALEHQVQQKKNPWLKSKPKLQRITVQSIAGDVQLPEMAMDSLDLSGITDRMQIGALGKIGPSGGMGMGGAGGGFGAGMGKGGMFSFLGQTAFGRRVVFVVDVSASMSMTGEGGKTRFEVMKRELIKSLQRLPGGTSYQVLFFSDFAWPHNETGPASPTFEKYRWSISADDYKTAKIPKYSFIVANGFKVSESCKIVEQADNPGGTNWGSGLLMALKGNFNKPDVIFFMTDGQASDEQGWIDVVTEENKKTRPATVIHTSVMMETGASAEMTRLAKANGGTFSIVMRDGTVVKGD